MNIRRASRDDIELLIKLRVDYLIADRGYLTDEEEEKIRYQLSRYFSTNINHSFVAVIAEINGKAAATAFLAVSEKPANPSFITGKTGTLLNVLTYPEYRRRGIATRLISVIIDEARVLDLSYIELSATEEGKPLYEKLGFFVPESKYTLMRLQLT